MKRKCALSRCNTVLRSTSPYRFCSAHKETEYDPDSPLIDPPSEIILEVPVIRMLIQHIAQRFNISEAEFVFTKHSPHIAKRITALQYAFIVLLRDIGALGSQDIALLTDRNMDYVQTICSKVRRGIYPEAAEYVSLVRAEFSCAVT